VCWLQGNPEAVKLSEIFTNAIREAEKEMIARNESGKSRARHSPSGIPYTLLYPSTNTKPIDDENRGVTGRGVP
jgi:hypothetical protein